MTPAGYADRIRALPRAERLALYRALPPGLLASQRYAGTFWASRKQAELLARDDLAMLELITGGRRAGKTWLAVMLFLRLVLSGRYRDLFPRIVAATDDDARDTVLLGRSGLLTWCPPEHLPRGGRKLPQKVQSIYFHTVDTEVHIITAEKPSQAIGQGSGLTLADDPAKWIDQCGAAKAREMMKQLRISNSEGRRPCIIIPSTPRSDAFLRQALTPGELRGARVTHLGSLDDNASLSPEYKASLADLRDDDPSEFDGVLRGEAPGALWKRAWIHYVDILPEMLRVVVAIDPADDAKSDSDETGIVVVGLGDDGRLYVLADYTARWRAEQWAAVAAWAYHRHDANVIVAEGNRAWSAVEHALNVAAPGVPVERVDAGAAKHKRAEPCALQYSEGIVSHLRNGPQLSRPGAVAIRVPMFDPATNSRPMVNLEGSRDRRGWQTLEDELCGWDPRKRRSPNGLDALVWGAWHLKPPEAEGFAEGSRFAGVGGVPGRYHDDDARIEPAIGVGVGGVEGRNADPRWER